MEWFIISLIVPIMAAYAVVSRGDREARTDWVGVFYRLSLAAGLGLGLSAAFYGYWLFFVGVPDWLYRFVDLAVFSAVGVSALIWKRIPASCFRECAAAPTRSDRADALLLATFIAVSVLALYGAFGSYLLSPIGCWDSWAIWNQRAHFIFRAGDAWPLAFSNSFPHPDYPILIPLCVARLWSFFGAEATWIPWLVGVIFSSATVGVLTSALWRLTNRAQGLIAGLFLLGAFPFLDYGTLQLADVPLAFFIVSAFSLLMMHDACGDDWKLAALGGMAAGLAAWTKNEGVLFVIALFASRCAVAWFRNGVKKVPLSIAVVAAGALPALLLVAVQKIELAGKSELLCGSGWHDLLSKVTDAARYKFIAVGFIRYTADFAGKIFYLFPLLVLFFGFRKDWRSRMHKTAGPIAAIGLMMIGYFWVYLTTPYNLQWHFISSYDRLLLQLWPSCLLIFFIHLAAPGKSQTAAPAIVPLRKNEELIGNAA